MRRIALSGLVAVAAVLGSVVPAAVASASPAPFPAVTRAGAVSAGATLPMQSPSATQGPGIEDNRISCGTTKSCLAVGASVNPSTRASAPYVRAWNGRAWRSPAVHLPKGATGATTAFTAVACKSATYCLVLGVYTTNAATNQTMHPFTLAWNGTALAPTAAPVLPSGANGYPTALSCLTAKNCIAVGEAFTNSGVSRPFIETWNGTKWTLRLTWGASATTLLVFGGVSCVSATYCMVSGEGEAVKAGTVGSPVPYLALWNGKTLTRKAVPVPPGTGKGQLIDDVSCTSTTNCVATGDSLTGSSSSQPLGFAFLEHWDGKAWTATKITWPAGTGFSLLLGVSCTVSAGAGRHCLATGATGSGNAGRAAAVTWNGKTWSVTKVPAPGTGKSSDLEDVSCVTAAACVAIGQIGATSGTTVSPLAGFWNGSAWKLTAT